MGYFTIFICYVRNGDKSTYDPRIVDDIFNQGNLKPESPVSWVDYADGYAEIEWSEKDAVETVFVSRPYGLTIMDRVWELSNRTGSFMFWPGNPWDHIFMAVTDIRVIDHMPKDLQSELDRIAVVRSGRELSDLLDLK